MYNTIGYQHRYICCYSKPLVVKPYIESFTEWLMTPFQPHITSAIDVAACDLLYACLPLA